MRVMVSFCVSFASAEAADRIPGAAEAPYAPSLALTSGHWLIRKNPCAHGQFSDCNKYP